MLVPKGFLRLWRVGRNAEDGGPAFGKGARQPGEVDGLLGAARGVRAWIEKQHEFLAGIVGQRDGARRHRAADGKRAPWRPRSRRICRGWCAAFAAAVCRQRLSASALRAWPCAVACELRPGAAAPALTVSRGPSAMLAVSAASPVPCAAVLLACSAVSFAAFSPMLTDCAAGRLARRPVLGDFLRVFLDIRLPFVAFGGSIMGYCGSCPGKPESSRPAGQV